MNFLKSVSTGAELNCSPCETDLIFLSRVLLIFALRTFSQFCKLPTWFLLIVEFDVDEELPDDEEIERRFSTLLVS